MSANWLDEQPADATAMAEVKQVVAKWRELREALAKAEFEYTQAKNLYEAFVKTDMVGKLRTNGIETLGLEDGSRLEVVQQTKCSIKKDKASQDQVAAWLREHDADNLVKSQLIVMPSQKAKLEQMGIAFDEEVSMNTNSVKAFILGEMRMNNIQTEDIPSGISWYQWDDIAVKES